MALLLLRLHTDSLVHNLNSKLLGAGNDLLALAERDVVVDDSGAATVLHHEHVDVLHVADVHAVKAVIATIAVAASGSETNAGHLSSSLEATTHGVIDTVRLPPSVTKADDGVAVVAMEVTSCLLELLHSDKTEQ